MGDRLESESAPHRRPQPCEPLFSCDKRGLQHIQRQRGKSDARVSNEEGRLAFDKVYRRGDENPALTSAAAAETLLSSARLAWRRESRETKAAVRIGYALSTHLTPKEAHAN